MYDVYACHIGDVVSHCLLRGMTVKFVFYKFIYYPNMKKFYSVYSQLTRILIMKKYWNIVSLSHSFFKPFRTVVML